MARVRWTRVRLARVRWARELLRRGLAVRPRRAVAGGGLAVAVRRRLAVRRGLAKRRGLAIWPQRRAPRWRALSDGVRCAGVWCVDDVCDEPLRLFDACRVAREGNDPLRRTRGSLPVRLHLDARTGPVLQQLDGLASLADDGAHFAVWYPHDQLLVTRIALRRARQAEAGSTARARLVVDLCHDHPLRSGDRFV